MQATNDQRLLDRLSKKSPRRSGYRSRRLASAWRRRCAIGYDIELYYERSNPLDIASLEWIIETLDDAGPSASVTAIGGWGPWVNGGGWLTVSGTRVDVLYRDLSIRTGSIHQSSPLH
jgi:hypothetical protein